MDKGARRRDDLDGPVVGLRSAAFNAAFVATFAALAIGGLPLLLAPRRVLLALVHLWARSSLGLLRLVCGTRVEFRGREHLPEGPAVMAVKHQSFLETIALVVAFDDFAFVLKKELAALPFFGWYVRASEQIAVDRGRRAGALPLLRQAVAAALARGRSVIIFPEGTRRPVGAPPAYKPGVALLCGEAGVPCTPVAVNTGLFWPRRGARRRPGRVVIEFLPAIPAGLDRHAFMAELERAIETATDALVAEALAADPRLDRALARDAAACRPSPVPT